MNEVRYKVKLPPLTDKFTITDITCEKPKQKEKNCPKETAASQRKIDIAKENGGEVRDILKCDVRKATCSMMMTLWPNTRSQRLSI